MSSIFEGCKSLKSLPELSKWKINNINDMINMFDDCDSLETLPDTFFWNNFFEMKKKENIFFELYYIPKENNEENVKIP